jgi:1,4-dihydroxy-2-naphthoyl-CoA hydrolase
VTGGPTPHGDVGVDWRAVIDRTVLGVLGIEVLSATPARVELRVPVTERVHQPYGILHGGVSALMAESAASFGAALAAPAGHHVVGIELNASHLRPMREGVLTAVATPVRVGRSVQVWEVVLTGDAGQEVCRARCTLSVVRSPVTPAESGAPAHGGSRPAKPSS